MTFFNFKSLAVAISLTSVAPSFAAPHRERDVDNFRRDDPCLLPVEPATWDAVGAGEYLNSFVSAKYDDWVNEMYKSIFHEDANMGCSAYDGSCNPGKSCKEFVEADPTNGVKAYWVLKAVSTLHDTLASVHETTQDNAILSGLKINDMVNDFGTPDDDTDPIAIAGAAFAIGAGISSPATPITGFLSVISGGFALASAGQKKPPPLNADLDTKVSAWFNESRSNIEGLMASATGGGDQATLPFQTTDSLWPADDDGPSDDQTGVANYFRHGSWLAKTPSQQQITAMLESGVNVLQAGMIVELLKATGYWIWIRTDITEDNCNKPTSWWLLGNCFEIQGKASSVPSGPLVSCGSDLISVDKAAKLVDKYHLYMDVILLNAYDCAASTWPDPSGKPDPLTLNFNADPPACFYNLNVVKTGAPDLFKGNCPNGESQELFPRPGQLPIVPP